MSLFAPFRPPEAPQTMESLKAEIESLRHQLAERDEPIRVPRARGEFPGPYTIHHAFVTRRGGTASVPRHCPR